MDATTDIPRNHLIRDAEHLLRALRVSLAQGAAFLTSRCAPNGPIMAKENLSYVHKAAWGMHAAGVPDEFVARLLDWARDKALRDNGDFFFQSEAPEYRVGQRVYRALTFGKVAAWVGHPLARDHRVIGRLLQYQHASGGVFNYIGDDPAGPEEQPAMGALNSSFFGHMMIALGRRSEAIRVGDWLCELVEANRSHLAVGRFYTNMTPAGKLVTEIPPGEAITHLVDTVAAKQEFWQPGTIMAYLAVLYDAFVSEWKGSKTDGMRYLDSARRLLEFEAGMPLYTYLWPSKCKVGWGAGELLRVLTKYAADDRETLLRAYQIARKVGVVTFLDNQLPGGGWSCMHYPLSESAPEILYEYKPLKGLVNVPDHAIEGSNTIFLPSEEITGEFLGEMKTIETGIDSYLAHLRDGG